MSRADTARDQTRRPEYAAPALDRAIDVLELLADREGGLSQSEIAESLGRSTSQLFRVLQRLERRGWIIRDRPSGLYGLSMAMFELAHRHPPLRGLVVAAIGPMRELAEFSGQSCNLSVVDGARVRIIAQVESPGDFGFRVRVGSAFALDTPAGALLSGGGPSGVLRSTDTVHAGITDLVVGIRDKHDDIRAAVTIPYISTSFSQVGVDDVIAQLQSVGELISMRLQGSETPPPGMVES